MTQNSSGSKSDKAAALRAYAKQQGKLALDLKRGAVEPVFYAMVTHKGRIVRTHVHRDLLQPEEVERQVTEAVRAAVEARRDANREANELEAQ